jgi:hypothetical protein
MKVDTGGGRERKIRVDYPSNSAKARQPASEKPKQDKIIAGEVSKRKRGFGGKLADTFLSEESPGVVNYIVMEVLVPAAKNMMSDAVSQGIERILFGDNRPRPGMGGRPGYTNYGRSAVAGAVRAADPRPILSRQARATHDFDEVILESRAEAEDVIDRLRDLISQYDVATVNDLYDLVGLTGEFTDDKWGWLDLRSASVRAIRGGYLLNLPRTVPIT